MTTVTRVLAWDTVFLHLSSAAIFVGLHVLIFVNPGEHLWWVLGFLLPILIVSLAGWAVQLQLLLLLRGTAQLRGRSADHA